MRTRLHKKYGEEEGERKFAEWRAKRADGNASAPVRPRGSGERAPRGRVAQSARKRDVYAGVSAGVFLADTLACYVSPSWREEHLTPEEVGRLGIALGDEILTSKTLTKWVLTAQKSSVHMRLALVCATIAMPRMASRGMLPEELADAFAGMASGGAHGNFRDDGFGEVGPDVATPDGDAETLRRVQNESGFDGVSGVETDNQSARHESGNTEPRGTAAKVRSAA